MPVFEFEGEWYAVKCRQAASTASPVIHYFLEDEPRVAYTNLTRYMKVMAVATEQGALGWSGAWWTEDTKALAAVHQRLNPGLPFPYYAGE